MVKTVYNQYTKQDMYVGANGRLFDYWIDAVDNILAAEKKHCEEVNYIAGELYGKKINELSRVEYKEVYNEYSKK